MVLGKHGADVVDDSSSTTTIPAGTLLFKVSGAVAGRRARDGSTSLAVHALGCRCCMLVGRLAPEWLCTMAPSGSRGLMAWSLT